MSKYIRMQQVEANPMNRGDYNILRGWTVPANENPADEGYVVHYQDGYVSWCQKAQFEAAVRPCSGMTFGMALEAMKRGAKVCREGWELGSYIWIMPASTVKGCKNISDPNLASIDREEGEIRFLDSIRVRTPKGDVLTGWLASQTELLAEDWQIVE